MTEADKSLLIKSDLTALNEARVHQRVLLFVLIIICCVYSCLSSLRLLAALCIGALQSFKKMAQSEQLKLPRTVWMLAYRLSKSLSYQTLLHSSQDPDVCLFYLPEMGHKIARGRSYVGRVVNLDNQRSLVPPPMSWNEILSDK